MTIDLLDQNVLLVMLGIAMGTIIFITRAWDRDRAELAKLKGEESANGA